MLAGFLCNQVTKETSANVDFIRHTVEYSRTGRCGGILRPEEAHLVENTVHIPVDNEEPVQLRDIIQLNKQTNVEQACTVCGPNAQVKEDKRTRWSDWAAFATPRVVHIEGEASRVERRLVLTSPLMLPTVNGGKPEPFDLYAVADHVGSVTGHGYAHYTAHVLIQGEWWFCDDANSQKTNRPKHSHNSYMVLYKRRAVDVASDGEPPVVMNVDPVQDGAQEAEASCTPGLRKAMVASRPTYGARGSLARHVWCAQQEEEAEAKRLAWDKDTQVREQQMATAVATGKRTDGLGILMRAAREDAHVRKKQKLEEGEKPVEEEKKSSTLVRKPTAGDIARFKWARISAKGGIGCMACEMMHGYHQASVKKNQMGWVEGTIGLNGFRVDALEAHEGADGKRKTRTEPGKHHKLAMTAMRKQFPHAYASMMGLPADRKSADLGDDEPLPKDMRARAHDACA